MIAQATSADESTAEREIILSREYEAPRALVWEAWTQERHLAKWWGPNGFTTTIQEIDVRPGGAWRYVMHAPDGTNYDNVVLYSEVVERERLVYVHGDGEDHARDFHVTVTFAERDGRTTVTSRMLLPNAEARRMAVGFGAVELGNQTFARLAEHLATL
jgi:uncharacterized protein YndB with AHSA1/START domain